MKETNATDFAARFAASSLSSLVDSFNRQVGLRGFNSQRAAHDQALIAEFVRRGIDIFAVSDGKTTSFAHPVVLSGNHLELKK